MPPAARLLPGPAGTSCLTCKRRAQASHKKCDRKRPVCDRCSRGGYECLGYGHNKSNGFTYEESLLSGAGSSPLPPEPSTLTSSPSGDSPRDDETLLSNDTPDIRTSDNRAEHPVQSGTAQVRQDLSSLLAFYDEDAVIFDTFPPTRSKTQVAEHQLPLPLYSVNAVTTQRPIFATSPLLFELASRMSKSVPMPPDVQGITEYVISHFDRFLSITYFKPQEEFIKKLQSMSIWRLSTCGFARQGMLIDARIYDSVIEGSHITHSSEFTRWIEGFEEAIRARLDEPLTPYELQERLHDVLEMFFAKGRLVSAATTYGLFCRTVPNFLQVVYSDPTLRPTQPGPNLISIAHLLASSRYGPAYYVLMDIKGSMIYGVPQLVDYDTAIELFHVEPHPVEWIDCLPGEFLVLLAKINARRDQRSSEDWTNIERQLISWELRSKLEPKGLESWKLIAWRALQETWRHTLLMYLYLAVCGVPTDDSRIQSSLRQIFQLVGVIRRQNPPASNVHFLSQLAFAHALKIKED
ncbi:unnamed protein product [Rhizoctonia solani]|uniref:Zn(2)-C6 fungal-type domain-containing protein n=1 Tax=Rhizoctonia solani TaxID=456999 RepID=A0A8H2XV17_9AGAM|nr:unnamed protein product [Rhizoctonia solani]